MAPNKFPTTLHRNTNRITLVLVYAVLEWALIFFLLLNSFFSYLIIKFANYFGLKPPCLLCSRLDHVLEPQNSKFSYRNLICEQHAIELSRSGYCFNHRKLVESQDMCEDCSSSHQDDHQHLSVLSVFRWLKEIGIVKSDGDCKVVENSDMNLRCSCCGVTINSHILSPKPSSGGLEDTQKANGGELRDIDLDGGPDRSRTDSLCIEVKDKDGIESRRDTQGFDSDLTKEDDNSEGLSFWLSKEGYSRVEIDEDAGDVILEAEAEPLLRGSTASMKGSCADETNLSQADEDEGDVVLGAETEPLLRSSTPSMNGSHAYETILPHADEDEGDVVLEEETEPLLRGSTPSMKGSYAGETILPQDLEFYIDFDDYQLLIPVESVKLEIEKGKGEVQVEREEEQKERDQEKATQLWRETNEELALEPDTAVAPAALDVVEGLNSSSLDLLKLDKTMIEDMPTKEGQEPEMEREVDFMVELYETVVKESFSKKGHEEETKRKLGNAVVLDADKVKILPTIQGQVESTRIEIGFQVALDQAHNVPLTTIDDQVTENREVTELNANVPAADFGNVHHIENDEIDVGNSVEPTDKNQVVDFSIPCKEECPSTNSIICEASSSTGLLENGGHESKQTEEMQSQNDITVEITEQELKSDVALSHESNEVEGDRTPDTPNSVDNLHHLHREMVLLQRTESVDEETLDGSVANVLNSGDGAVTVEELKSVLQSERRTLRALYAELEEERNAAAIATNQTMAMINRLQEDKAAIEMEALQYQRMMEEQSEYDQEALQLMNEILVKREKEIQELEKELEIYRKKVMDYEERERMRFLSQRKDRCCGNGEENDGSSVDLSNESREDDCSCRCEENGYHHNTPVDAILNLHDSLSSFEEERISIFEQLKVLEEKLCALAEEEEHHIGNMKPFEQFYQENAKEFERNFKLAGDANRLENGSSIINGKHHQERRMNGQKPKQLLPLFDAAELESDDEQSNGIEEGLDPLVMHKSPLTKYESEKRRLTIEEEVDHVYERLHALEADKEFIKHCIGSLKKGDRGVDILQEILQHLRDLKNVELQARNVYGVC